MRVLVCFFNKRGKIKLRTQIFALDDDDADPPPHHHQHDHDGFSYQHLTFISWPQKENNGSLYCDYIYNIY